MSKNKSKPKPPPRNALVVPMNLRNKSQVFADRREPRGGDKNMQKELLDIYDEDEFDCIVSFEQTERELAEVENEIAIKLGLTENIRATLLELDKLNCLVENELVARWHELYASYVDWLDYNKRNDNV
jgi:hypothetical protein